MQTHMHRLYWHLFQCLVLLTLIAITFADALDALFKGKGDILIVSLQVFMALIVLGHALEEVLRWQRINEKIKRTNREGTKG